MAESVDGAAAAARELADRLSPRDEEPRGTRAGPLVVVGRFYVSLTIILAVAATAASYFDSRGAAPSLSVIVIRYAVLGCVIVGLLSALVLMATILRQGILFLSSPTELSDASQQHLLAYIKGPEKGLDNTSGVP